MLVAVERWGRSGAREMQPDVFAVALAVDVPGLAFDLFVRVVAQDCEAGRSDRLLAVGTQDLELSAAEIGGTPRTSLQRNCITPNRSARGDSGTASGAPPKCSRG